MLTHEILEEKEYKKLIKLSDVLSSLGVSKIEQSEIFEECSIKEIEELIRQLKNNR